MELGFVSIPHPQLYLIPHGAPSLLPPIITRQGDAAEQGAVVWGMGSSDVGMLSGW